MDGKEKLNIKQKPNGLKVSKSAMEAFIVSGILLKIRNMNAGALVSGMIKKEMSAHQYSV